VVLSSAGFLSLNSSLAEPDLMFDDSVCNVDQSMVGFDRALLHQQERFIGRAVSLD
jgi:hypothetical protein